MSLDTPDVDVTPLPLRKARISWVDVDNATGYVVSNNTRNNLNKPGCDAPPTSTAALSFEICLDEYLADTTPDTFSISAVDSTGTYLSAAADIRVIDNPILTGGSANGYSPGDTGQAVVKWGTVPEATEYTLRWRKLPGHEILASDGLVVVPTVVPHSHTAWRPNPAAETDWSQKEDLEATEYTVPGPDDRALDHGGIYAFQVIYEYADGTGFSAREAYAWIGSDFPTNRVATYPFFGYWPDREYSYVICDNTFPEVRNPMPPQTTWPMMIEQAFSEWETTRMVAMHRSNRECMVNPEIPISMISAVSNNTNEVFMVDTASLQSAPFIGHAANVINDIGRLLPAVSSPFTDLEELVSVRFPYTCGYVDTLCLRRECLCYFT